MPAKQDSSTTTQLRNGQSLSLDAQLHILTNLQKMRKLGDELRKTDLSPRQQELFSQISTYRLDILATILFVEEESPVGEKSCPCPDREPMIV